MNRNNFNQPRDLEAAQQALPQERAEIRADVFTGANHASLPGIPADEQYMIGDELNRVDGIDQGQFSQGVTMEGFDAANLYPVSNPFPDQQPVYDQYQGHDSMQGIVSGAIPVSLSGDRMYVSPIGNLPVGFHEASNVNPEIAGYRPTVNQGPANTDE